MNTNHTDIKPAHFIIRMLPARVRPYAVLMRLDRPIGIWLLLLPALWAIVLAGGAHDYTTIMLFIMGAIVMRGAGCVINDLWDADMDARVARTRARPLASGALSKKQAVSFLFLLLMIGLVILLQMNFAMIMLGFITIPLIVLYPLMKRITYFPQVFLGVVFNFGALMGWSAITGAVSPHAMVLYVSGIFWTLGYDTIYAVQDMEDDALIGVRSTALRFGRHIRAAVAALYVVHIGLLMSILMSISAIGALMLLSPAFVHLGWQVYALDINKPQNALRIFKSNQVYGCLVLTALLLLSV